MEVPAWAYKRHAVHGDIDENELLELEKFASDFNKEALNLSSITKNPMARDILTGTAVATAAPLIGYGAMKGIDALGNIGQARRDRKALGNILSVHPDIGDPSDPRVNMAFNTLKTMNPEFAADPLLAGPLMKQIVESRMDPMNPSSGSYVDPGQAAKLMELRNNTKKVKSSPSLSGMVGQSMTQGIPRGFDSALSRQRQLGDLAENREYSEQLYNQRQAERKKEASAFSIREMQKEAAKKKGFFAKVKRSLQVPGMDPSKLTKTELMQEKSRMLDLRRRREQAAGQAMRGMEHADTTLAAAGLGGLAAHGLGQRLGAKHLGLIGGAGAIAGGVGGYKLHKHLRDKADARAEGRLLDIRDELKSRSKVANVSDFVGNAAIPYDARRKKYVQFLNREAKSKVMSRTGGAMLGLASGALAGAIASKTPTGAKRLAAKGVSPLGAIIIGALGLTLAIQLAISIRQGNIDKAKRILKKGNIDEALAEKIMRDQQARRSMEKLEKMRVHSKLDRIESNTQFANF